MPAPRRAGYRRHGTHRHLVRSPFRVRAGPYLRTLGPGLVERPSASEPSWAFRWFARVGTWLALVLFLYVISGFLAGPDWGQVLRDPFVPHVSLSREFLSSVVAILGTTISPYMFFWICSQEVEEEG